MKGRMQPAILFYERDYLVTSPPTRLEIPDDAVYSPSAESGDDLLELEKSFISIESEDEGNEEESVSPEQEDKNLLQSFCLLSPSGESPHNNDEVIDFLVTRTNWIYRRQIRKYRFERDEFLRSILLAAAVVLIFFFPDSIRIQMNVEPPGNIPPCWTSLLRIIEILLFGTPSYI